MQAERMNLVWQSIPSQFAKENRRFVYGVARPGAGNGQDELLGLLSGEQLLVRDAAATIQFHGQPVANLRPDARRKMGLAFVPAERLGHGAVPELSLADNALLTGSLTPQNYVRQVAAVGELTVLATNRMRDRAGVVTAAWRPFADVPEVTVGPAFI